METFKIEIHYGTVDLQQRPVFDGNRVGYESRTVAKDRDGIVTKISEWKSPLCWLVFHEPEPRHRPWWVRLFGAA